MKVSSLLTECWCISLVFSKGIHKNVTSFYMFFVEGSEIFIIFYCFTVSLENTKCLYMVLVKNLRVLVKSVEFLKNSYKNP